jgi:glutamate dehydrogenase (NAD(P)+)
MLETNEDHMQKTYQTNIASNTNHGLWNQFLIQIQEIYPFITPDLQPYFSFLTKCENTLAFNIPFQKQDGDFAHLDAFRVQHNSALGPYKGGIRFHPQVCLDEVSGLAGWMTIKSANLGLPYGGGKGGVCLDPAEFTPSDLKKIMALYAEKVSSIVGPYKDIPAPDVNTNADMMAVFFNTYAKITKEQAWGVITGKPLSMHGSAGRTNATGEGVFYAALLATQAKKKNITEATVAIQGFGNVGIGTAIYFAKHNAKITAIFEKDAIIYNPKGLDIDALSAGRQNKIPWSNLVAQAVHSGAKIIDTDTFWSLPIDILVLAALENQVDGRNAPLISAPIILEGANGPITPEGESILLAKGLQVIPDVFANSGGVCVSYYEWVQNLQGKAWSENTIHESLYNLFADRFAKLDALVQQNNISWRQAVFLLACEQILPVYHILYG